MYFLKPFESRLRLVNGKRCSRRFPKGDDKRNEYVSNSCRRFEKRHGRLEK